MKTNKPRPLTMFESVSVGGENPNYILHSATRLIIVIVPHADSIATAMSDATAVIDYDRDGWRVYRVYMPGHEGLEIGITLREDWRSQNGRNRAANTMNNLSSHARYLLPIADADAFRLASTAAGACVKILAFLVADSFQSAARQLVAMGAAPGDFRGTINLLRWPFGLSQTAVTVGLERKERVPKARAPVPRMPGPHQGLSLDEYQARFKTSLARRWRDSDDDHIFTAVGDIGDLKARFSKRHAEVVKLPGLRRAEAFALALPDGLSELWVHAGLARRRYYDIWCRFLQVRHGIRYRTENQRRYQLDHAYNLATIRAKEDANFVLLTAIDRSVNASWGYIERMFSHDGMHGNAMQFATWFTMPKLLGIRAPSFAMRADPTVEFDRIWSDLLRLEAVTQSELGYFQDGMEHFASMVRQGMQNAVTKPRFAAE